MTALVVPFTLSRRRDLIRRQASWFLEQGHRAAERNLSRQLDVQRTALLSKGIDPERVDGEVRALAAAIRAEVWRRVLAPEVGA